jgi:hypothetical protein
MGDQGDRIQLKVESRSLGAYLFSVIRKISRERT